MFCNIFCFLTLNAIEKIKSLEIICIMMKNVLPLQCKTSRSGAVVARWAHNPKVVGSSPTSATKAARLGQYLALPFLFITSL